MTISSESSELTSSAHRGGSEGGDWAGRNQRGRRVTLTPGPPRLTTTCYGRRTRHLLPGRQAQGHTQSGGGQTLGTGSAPTTGPPQYPGPTPSPSPSSALHSWATSKKQTPVKVRICGHEGTRVCSRSPSCPHSRVPGCWGLVVAGGLCQRPPASLRGRGRARPGRGGRAPPRPSVRARRSAAALLHAPERLEPEPALE